MDIQFSNQYFRKFPKIELIECARDQFPTADQLRNHQYRLMISEKVDGSNIGLYIPIGDRNQPVYPFTRNGDDPTSLYNFEHDCNQLTQVVDCIRHYYGDQPISGIYLWGEYYGSNILRRIKYRNKGTFVFYNMMIVTDINDRSVKMVNPDQFNQIVDDLVGQFDVDPAMFLKSTPIDDVYSIDDLINTIKFPVKSAFADDDDVEGFVITVVDNMGSIVNQFKIKDSRFAEKKATKVVINRQSSVIDARNLFQTYITDSRAVSVISKTADRSNIPNLVRMLIADAKQQFMADNPHIVETYDKDQLKFIFNAGNAGFIAIKRALSQS